MKFTYQYEPILDVKKSEKKQAQQSLKAAQDEKQMKQDQLDILKEKLLEAEKRYSEKQYEGTSIIEFQKLAHDVTSLREQLNLQEKAVNEAVNLADQKQDQLKESVIEEKTWIWLKDQKRIIHESLAKKHEQALLDEMITSRYSRRING
jgi:flagellar protein FliJ